MPELRLVVREPEQPERNVALFPGASVGRAQGTGLTLNDPAVSRAHFRVLCEENRWFVEDLGSSTGTVVDGVQTLRKGQRAALQHGSKLTAGDTEMLVGIERDTASGTIPGVPSEAAKKPEVGATMPVMPPIGLKRKPTPPEPARRPETGEVPVIPVPPVRASAEPTPVSARGADASDDPPQPDRGAEVISDEPSTNDIPDVDPQQQTRRVETTEQVGLSLRPRLLARNARLMLVSDKMRRPVPVDHTPFLVGRGNNAHLMLADSSISTEHARLYLDAADQLFAEDLGSKNGTCVGADKLTAKTPTALRLPCALRFGTVEAWLVDDLSASREQERRDRAACDVLVRAGRLTADEREQAIEAARAGRRHLSELILQQTKLTVAEWADAAARVRPGGGALRWLVLLLLLAALGGGAYWYFVLR